MSAARCPASLRRPTGPTWRPDDIRPFVDHVIGVFGPGRLIFGSDWPVCLLAATYEEVHQVARELLAGLSDAEQARVFGDTAVAVYRLGTSS